MARGVAPPRPGMMLPQILHPAGDYVSDVIRATGDYYERPILDEVARRVRGGTLVDVGAHIGNHAAFLSTLGTVHAFEPIPENVALLRQNAPQAHIYPIALGDHGGTARFERDAVNAGHSRISAFGEIEVEMATLDSFELRDVSLIKIDVEGYEPQVLAGAQETIDRWHPLLVIEDWTGALTIRGYERVVSWEREHQTFLWQ